MLILSIPFYPDQDVHNKEKPITEEKQKTGK